jgi:hypothetical protein
MAFSDPGVRAVAVDDEEFRIEFDSTAMLIVSLREDGDGRDRPRRAEPGVVRAYSRPVSLRPIARCSYPRVD